MSNGLNMTCGRCGFFGGLHVCESPDSSPAPVTAINGGEAVQRPESAGEEALHQITALRYQLSQDRANWRAYADEVALMRKHIATLRYEVEQLMTSVADMRTHAIPVGISVDGRMITEAT